VWPHIQRNIRISATLSWKNLFGIGTLNIFWILRLLSYCKVDCHFSTYKRFIANIVSSFCIVWLLDVVVY
jgi:hypothetical protein